MDAYGNLHKEHAFDEYGRAITFGLQYMRSCPLNSIRLMVPPKSRTTWFTIDHVSSVHLKLNPHEEDRVITISRAKGPLFLAHSLMKVLLNKISWESNFKFFGRANFQAFVLEWTESILNDFGDIYGVVAVSHQIEAKDVNSNQARILFRSEFMVYRPNVFLAHEDCILLDTESLTDDAFKFLICMRSALLPVRMVDDCMCTLRGLFCVKNFLSDRQARPKEGPRLCD
ncbi:unnamed protein product [Prunus brigantina]